MEHFVELNSNEIKIYGLVSMSDFPLFGSKGNQPAGFYSIIKSVVLIDDWPKKGNSTSD